MTWQVAPQAISGDQETAIIEDVVVVEDVTVVSGVVLVGDVVAGDVVVSGAPQRHTASTNAEMKNAITRKLNIDFSSIFTSLLNLWVFVNSFLAYPIAYITILARNASQVTGIPQTSRMASN
jgi:hypothetical protein